MTEPRPTDELNSYLAALNAALGVGLRSRSRILEEAGEHLYQAALAEHEELHAQLARRERPVRPNAELWAEAQRRTLAAFGSAEKVAAGFENGPLGALDTRLGLADARVERWLGRRPVLAGTIWAAATSIPWLVLGVAISAVGALFGVGHTANVLMVFVPVSVLFFCCRTVCVLRRKLPTGGVATWRGLIQQPRALRLVALRDWCGYFFFVGYATLTDPMSFMQLLAAWIGLALVVELAARLARRAGHGAGCSAYGSDPDENWSRYSSGLWTSTGITLTLIGLTSGPSGLAGALGLLLVGATGTTALARRLAWNSSVKRNWGRTYEARAAAAR